MFDKLTKLLNRLGYQPIFLAQTNVAPVDVYNFTDDRRLIRRGPLNDYHPAADGFTTTRGAKADIVNTETSSKRMSGAASFLKAALQAIGVQGNLDINLGFAQGSDLRFSFADVTYKRVDPSVIDAVIEGADFSGVPDHYLAAGRLHLVYEYLYASQLLMRKADHSKFDAAAEASIQSMVDANVAAGFDRTRMSEIKFAGRAPAAFAYKAGRLERVANGRWYFYPEEVVFRRARAADTTPLMSPDTEATQPAGVVPFSTDVERLLPFTSPDLVPERRPFLPSEGTVLTVESE